MKLGKCAAALVVTSFLLTGCQNSSKTVKEDGKYVVASLNSGKKDKNIYSRVDVKSEKGRKRDRVHISFELLDKFNDAAKHSSLIKGRVSDVLKEEGSTKTESYYKKLKEKPFRLVIHRQSRIYWDLDIREG